MNERDQNNLTGLVGGQAAEGVLPGLCALERTTVRITWWDEDGTERTGWANVAPDASPETLMALTHMMQVLGAHGRPEEAHDAR